MKSELSKSVNHLKICCSFLLFLLFLSEMVYAGICSDKSATDDEPYHFRSSINNMEYSLLISLPNSYYENSSQKYPVLYVLDGQWDFNLMVQIYHNLRFDNSIPDIIIVGIAYYGLHANYDSLRAVDMTPAKDHSNAGTGGGDKFLDVLKKEIIPYVDNNYNTNRQERGISGTSLAGFYAHYLMFRANDLFNGFIMVNPYLVWDNEVSFNVENEYSLKSNSLNARVYMTSGEFDISDVFLRMVDQIQSQKYIGLDLDYTIQKGIGHTGSKHDGYSRGLIQLFRQKTITPDQEYLRKYTGDYITESNDTVHMVLDGENLVIQKSKMVPFDLRIYALPDSGFCTGRNYVPFYLKEIPDKNMYEFSYEGFLHQLKAFKDIVR